MGKYKRKKNEAILLRHDDIRLMGDCLDPEEIGAIVLNLGDYGETLSNADDISETQAPTQPTETGRTARGIFNRLAKELFKNEYDYRETCKNRSARRNTKADISEDKSAEGDQANETKEKEIKGTKTKENKTNAFAERIGR